MVDLTQITFDHVPFTAHSAQYIKAKLIVYKTVNDHVPYNSRNIP